MNTNEIDADTRAILSSVYDLGPEIWGASGDRYGEVRMPAPGGAVRILSGYIVESIRINGVAELDAGPCVVCGKPMARLDVTKHTDHNGYEYDQRAGTYYHAHRDGSAPCSNVTAYGTFPSYAVQPRCPSCRAYGTLTTAQLAYGDRTTCPCGHDVYRSIGD